MQFLDELAHDRVLPTASDSPGFDGVSASQPDPIPQMLNTLLMCSIITPAPWTLIKACEASLPQVDILKGTVFSFGVDEFIAYEYSQ